MSGPSLRTRQAVVARDEGRCVACGLAVAALLEPGYSPLMQFSLQHRVARGMGGRSVINDPTNLLTMCGTGTTGCHGRAEREPEWARSRGYRVDSWEDPETVPVVVAVCPGEDCVMALDADTRFRVYPAELTATDEDGVR